MKRPGLIVLALLASTPLRAADFHTMSFPPAHDLFLPLQADPSELRFSIQVGPPVSRRSISQVNIGDYLGLYRWALPFKDSAVQINIGGAVNTRFDATGHRKLQVVDYYGNLPVDFNAGKVSGRVMFYHDSSHLGDDYIRATGILGEDNSWEAIKTLLSIHPWTAFRFYGGFTRAIHTKPDWRGVHALQGGMEIFFNNSRRVHWHPYWATDIQSWERSAWTPTWTSQIGIRTGSPFSRGRGISYYIQMMSGPRVEGQFFGRKETLWSLGFRFQLSQAPESPALR